MSQWGHDFRTDYFAVKEWIEQFTYGSKSRKFPILALTATARKKYVPSQDTTNLPTRQKDADQASTISDIIEKLKLGIREEQAIITSPQRNELAFRVEHIATPPCSCGGMLVFEHGKAACQTCQKTYNAKSQEKGVEQLKLIRLAYLLNESGVSGLRQRWSRPSGMQQRGLIYCAYTTATIPIVVEYLKQHIPDLRVGMYHGRLESEEKEDVLQRFKYDSGDGLDVIVATNAFGMGIDVRRLGFVLHFDIPGTFEAFYQEAGRAGRDETFSKDAKQEILQKRPFVFSSIIQLT